MNRDDLSEDNSVHGYCTSNHFPTAKRRGIHLSSHPQQRKRTNRIKSGYTGSHHQIWEKSQSSVDFPQNSYHQRWKFHRIQLLQRDQPRLDLPFLRRENQIQHKSHLIHARIIEKYSPRPDQLRDPQLPQITNRGRADRSKFRDATR